MLLVLSAEQFFSLWSSFNFLCSFFALVPFYDATNVYKEIEIIYGESELLLLTIWVLEYSSQTNLTIWWTSAIGWTLNEHQTPKLTCIRHENASWLLYHTIWKVFVSEKPDPAVWSLCGCQTDNCTIDLYASIQTCVCVKERGRGKDVDSVNRTQVGASNFQKFNANRQSGFVYCRL